MRKNRIVRYLSASKFTKLKLFCMKETHNHDQKAKMRGVARGIDGFLPDLATKRDFSDEARLAEPWFSRDVKDRMEVGLMSWKK